MKDKVISQDATAARDRNDPPRRILVVDDDPAMRELNTAVLSRAGYEVDSAGDGEAGFAALMSNLYDLVITDNVMPRLTGIEMLKKLRAARMALPVIMATGHAPTHEFASHPWLQPDFTLLKPYTIGQILTAVEVVLQTADAREPGPPFPKPERPISS